MRRHLAQGISLPPTAANRTWPLSVCCKLTPSLWALVSHVVTVYPLTPMWILKTHLQTATCQPSSGYRSDCNAQSHSSLPQRCCPPELHSHLHLVYCCCLHFLTLQYYLRSIVSNSLKLALCAEAPPHECPSASALLSVIAVQSPALLGSGNEAAVSKTAQHEVLLEPDENHIAQHCNVCLK